MVQACRGAAYEPLPVCPCVGECRPAVANAQMTGRICPNGVSALSAEMLLLLERKAQNLRSPSALWSIGGTDSLQFWRHRMRQRLANASVRVSVRRRLLGRDL